jgi:hypothetical protein
MTTRSDALTMRSNALFATFPHAIIIVGDMRGARRDDPS